MRAAKGSAADGPSSPGEGLSPEMGTAVVVGSHLDDKAGISAVNRGHGSVGPFEYRARCATKPRTEPISGLISKTDRVRYFGSAYDRIRPVKHLYGIWRILTAGSSPGLGPSHLARKVRRILVPT